MALTATCTMNAHHTILRQLCMEKAVDVSHSTDQPNIIMSTQLMPAKMEDWNSYLDEDITVVQTHSERRCVSVTLLKWLAASMNTMRVHFPILTPRVKWYHPTESLPCIIPNQLNQD